MLSFNPVGMLDKTEYRIALSKLENSLRCCDYAYANLLCWSDVYNTHFSKDDYGYYFRVTNKGNTKYLSPVAKQSEYLCALKNLIDFEKSSGESKIELLCVPEKYAFLIEKEYDTAIITEARNNFDYLYLPDKLRDFSGKPLHSKKNHKNRFFKTYGDVYSYKKMTCADIDECLNFNEQWYKINYEYQLESEKTATHNLLANFEKLGLIGGMIYVNEKLCAYTLASDFFDGSDTLVVHAEKGLYDIDGIYPTICSEFIKHEGCFYAYINREDDVGDEGLRKSKLSYKPETFEKKFLCTINL